MTKNEIETKMVETLVEFALSKDDYDNSDEEDRYRKKYEAIAKDIVNMDKNSDFQIISRSVPAERERLGFLNKKLSELEDLIKAYNTESSE